MEEKILAAAKDYIEGWYQGNAERMERGISPALVKRRPSEDGTALEELGAEQMIEFTRAGYGKESPHRNAPITVQLENRFGPIASVKIVGKEFIDLLHLTEIQGEWKIVNALWIPSGKAEN